MFKAKAARLAAFALVVAGAAFFISCQNGATEPTPKHELTTQQDGVLGIHGYTYEAITQEKLIDVEVEWWCETCSEWLGSDAVDDVAHYDIYYDGDWSDHDGHNMRGYASKPGYETAENTITNFQSVNIPYERDFYLYRE
jgi:hypothetical protein